ncbi:MAG: cytochrome oxidase biosynthesis protein [Betaproteobacteria bacterium]|nr:cytochrome oxidase biosynthesis protein [Betaproteobacteria bacterium]
MLRLRARPKFSLVPALAAAGLIALTVGLGNWQSRRALEKDVIEARHAQTRDAAELALTKDPLTLDEVDGRRVSARGRFEPGLTIYWDNQIVNHVPGFAIIVPFKLAGSEKRVLVDRGLLPATGDRSNLAGIPAPAGEVELHGRAYYAPKRTMELQQGVDRGQVWENLSPAKFASTYKLDLHDFIMRETGPAPAGLARMTDNGGPPAETGMTAARHRGYAFQWYSLAALAALLFLLFTFLDYDNAARDA